MTSDLSLLLLVLCVLVTADIPDIFIHDVAIKDDDFAGFDMEGVQAIVDKTGLRNFSSQITEKSANRFIIDLYGRLEQGEDLPAASGHSALDVAILKADTVRSIPAKGSDRRRSDRITLTFDVSAISSGEETTRAELRVLPKNGQAERALFRAKLTIFDGTSKVKRLTYRVTSSEPTSDGFVVLDLTTIIRDVVDSGYGDAKLKISLNQISNGKHKKRRGRRALPYISLSDKEDDAMLVIFSKDKEFFQKFHDFRRDTHSHSISKRDVLSEVIERAKRNQRESCQKQDLVVDFSAIGWAEWIVYPLTYNAFQCAGRCPTPVAHSYDPTNHAILQSLMRLVDRQSVQRPCCVPTKLKPMSMLYYEKDLIVVRHHEDMVVDKCGCR